MLRYEQLLDKMTMHFAKWMDIRKRVKTSNGGKVLQAIAEETALIQEAIDDYKKDFFLETYIGKEEDIVDYVFRIQVGRVDLKDLKLITPSLPIQTDVKAFYANQEIALYQEDYLYIHKKHIDTDTTVVYEVYDKKYALEPQLFHVWNIYDEFAAFLGLKRFAYETNLELEKRILNYPKKRINTTEDGLKHALITQLINLDPELTEDEIIVEGVTPENLKEQYKDFDTVIEALAHINKDVYRLKRWDIDTWQYTYRSVDYIPHFWDVALDLYKNGVGKKEDLQVSISKENDTTNAVAMFYTKNIERASEVLEKKALTEELELDLKRYNDSLKPVKAKYRIDASEAVEITGDGITLEYSDVDEVSHMISLSEIVEKRDGEYHVENVEVDDSETRIKAGQYKIQLSPQKQYSHLLIKDINIEEDDEVTELAKPTDDFIETPDGLIHAHTKLFANRVKDFTYSENASNVGEGVGIAPGSNDALLKLNLDGLQNQNFNIGFTSEYLEVQDIQAENFNYSDGVWESVIAASTITLEFELECNSFTFTVEGKAKAIIDFNGNHAEMTMNQKQVYQSASYSTAVPCRVKIISTSAMEKLRVYNIGYNVYETNYSLANGEIKYIDGQGFYLPDFQENELTIQMRALTSKSPILRYVNVGDSGPSKIYLTDAFTVKQEATVHLNVVGFNAEIIPVGPDGELIYDKEQGYNNNFNPIIHFKATGEYAKIYLDLSDYMVVNTIQVPSGKYITYDGPAYITIPNGTIASVATIEGIVAVNRQRRTLIDIFSLDTEKGDKLYVSNLFKGFIYYKDKKHHYIKLNELPEYEVAFRGSLLSFDHLPEELIPVFEETLSRSIPNSVVSHNSYYGAVRDCYLHYNPGINYIAYNQYDIFTESKSVEMIDTFQPFLQENQLYLYQVEKIQSKVSIQFEAPSNKPQFSLGKSNLILNCDFDKLNSAVYGVEKIKLPLKVLLNKNIPLQETYTLNSGEIISLNQFMITPPKGCSIQYITKPAHQAETESYPDIVKENSIVKREDGFNKLAHCQINEMLYVTNQKPINGEVLNPLTEGEDFEVLKEEGILVWLKPELTNERYYIKYTINKPTALTLSDDLIYEKIEYDINGYNSPPTIVDNIKDKKDGDFFELSAELLKSDRIVVKCDKAGFRGYLENNGIRFKRVIANDVVSVKSGYYYMDGLEYYLFAKEHTESIDQTVDAKFVNVEKIKDALLLRKPSHNYIQNSMLNLKGIEQIYNKDYTERSDLKGISSLNALTACNSYSHWNSRGMNLSFADGKNGTGIRLTNFIEDGYMFVEITENLFKHTRFSMYATPGIRAYIGVSDFIIDVPNTEATFIHLEKELTPSIADLTTLETTIDKELNRNYFLIIKGSGVIDDIVAIDQDTFDIMSEYHTKNIDVLGLDIEETYPTDSIQRLLISQSKGFKNEGAEINNEGFIVNSPIIHWGVTKIKDFQDQNDWAYCLLHDCEIKNNMIVSGIREGIVETEPIYLGQIETIKNLIIKINEIDADQMTGMMTTLLVSDRYDGTYRVLTSTTNNIGKISGKQIDQYIKLRITMGSNKVLHSLKIFSEYKTTDQHAPVERVISNGVLLTPILDTHYQAYYELSHLDIESISNLNDIKIEIRGAKENTEENVWTDWKQVKINDNLNLDTKLRFRDYRFFQMRITLSRQDAYLKLNYIDMKVVQD